ncbi:hypothetical protein R0137_07600 [Congregibacter brevis]|uniref:Uncharacterized protein n=1 Tax=Congregibacter brevis TaxID=3081201 RepID=A0ABZ0IGX9_9GAMM|nr:hypothetical protein R0137_07600 [Congregibacter sp. IMCC45268]
MQACVSVNLDEFDKAGVRGSNSGWTGVSLSQETLGPDTGITGCVSGVTGCVSGVTGCVSGVTGCVEEGSPGTNWITAITNKNRPSSNHFNPLCKL